VSAIHRYEVPVDDPAADARDLMARAKAGDLGAFGKIYSRHRDEVFRYARARLPHLADDITQDVFILALKNLHQWHDQGVSPGAWLRTITANLCTSRAREAYHRRVVLVDFDMDRADPGDSPDKQVADRLLRERVGAALANLPKDQRRAVSLYYLDGLSTSETAEAMGRTGVSRQATTSMLFRARRALANSLAGVADA